MPWTFEITGVVAQAIITQLSETAIELILSNRLKVGGGSAGPLFEKVDLDIWLYVIPTLTTASANVNLIVNITRNQFHYTIQLRFHIAHRTPYTDRPRIIR